ncbi:hypothetical protein DFH08DRAFT_961411 [Mycena albidolilacea]|uniref:Uncharacterized protein n=1 Tax=Mycena albidolilacea TaxID=1033008 RepID=A0AAD7A0G5_9AGAR|nr:hypothetical protein DFH08DRAFT_961411 [Mycena albidolilacea]
MLLQSPWPSRVNDSSTKATHVFITDFLKEKGVSTLDVLVNNAAIGSECFKETFDVNVVGTVAVTWANVNRVLR